MRRVAMLAGLVSALACGPSGDDTRDRPAADPGVAADPSASPDPRAAPTVPERPTFAEHVAEILYEHCATCHHAGGSGPLPLTSYDDAHDHATQIVEVTASGFMPPWLPRGHGRFVGERRLDETDRATLARWVEQGRARGPLDREPAPPTFDDGWRLGAPDLVLDTGAPFELEAEGADVYRNFVVAVPPGPTRWVRTIEILPGDPRVVHHAVLRVDTTGSVRRLDAEDPAPGFDGMVFAGARMPDGRFLGWTPGKRPEATTDARAFRLVGGSDLVLQLHLRPSGKPEPIAARLGVHWAEGPPRAPALSLELSSTEIEIPAGATDVHARDRYTLPVDVRIASVYPHAHYLGKQLVAWAELPGGERRELVEIDDWDFDWQDEYRYVHPISLPRGSTLHMDWRFDNSSDNPHNPSSPPVRVGYGSRSVDEMAELIVEVEPVDPRELATLDQDYGRKWLADQAALVQRRIDAEPNHADDHADLAAFRQLLGDTDGALAAYRRALELDPKHVRATTEIGIVLVGAGQLDTAVGFLRRATTLSPDDAAAHLALANALRKQGDTKTAITHYRRAIALDDTNAAAHNNLGIVLEAQGDLVGARAEFERAVELQPAQPMFAKNLARVRSRG